MDHRHRLLVVAACALSLCACDPEDLQWLRDHFADHHQPGQGHGHGCNLDPCEGGIGLPSDQHYVAPGLCARLVARHQDKLRHIVFAPNGDLFGVTTAGEIRRYRDVDCDGELDAGAPEQVLWAHTGGNGTGLHLTDDYLYANGPSGVQRFAYSENADVGGAPEDVVVDVPNSGNHTYNVPEVIGDFLYVHSGSDANLSFPASPDYDRDRSVIKRFDLSQLQAGTPFEWQAGEVYAVGLRNAVGITHVDRALYGVVNGIDDLHYNGVDIHERNPGEQFLLIEKGGRYGYPFCFSALDVTEPDGDAVAPGTQLHVEAPPGDPFVNPHDDAWCADNSTPPDTLFAAHSAPLDLVFQTMHTRALPRRWTGGAYVTLHGSWNRDASTGFKVVWVPVDRFGRAQLPELEGDEPMFSHEVVFGGGAEDDHVDGIWGWSITEDGGEIAGEDYVRPVGVAISPVDGALYVSSDNARIFGSGDMSSEDGALYRIARLHDRRP